EYMAKILDKRPILLLDDVFSELDASHRAHVVEIVSKQQTIIATVELENIPQKFLDSARILRIEDGKVVLE
ncbi:MAG: DNA replication and repair protein RecF, partial [Patescibacteria group bacterium]